MEVCKETYHNLTPDKSPSCVAKYPNLKEAIRSPVESRHQRPIGPSTHKAYRVPDVYTIVVLNAEGSRQSICYAYCSGPIHLQYH